MFPQGTETIMYKQNKETLFSLWDCCILLPEDLKKVYTTKTPTYHHFNPFKRKEKDHIQEVIWKPDNPIVETSAALSASSQTA